MKGEGNHFVEHLNVIYLPLHPSLLQIVWPHPHCFAWCPGETSKSGMRKTLTTQWKFEFHWHGSIGAVEHGKKSSNAAGLELWRQTHCCGFVLLHCDRCKRIVMCSTWWWNSSALGFSGRDLCSTLSDYCGLQPSFQAHFSSFWIQTAMHLERVFCCWFSSLCGSPWAFCSILQL